jgi:hypothetical protein
MSKARPAINLQFGNDAFSYQDLISFIKTPSAQIMPSSRGSHSEISGT